MYVRPDVSVIMKKRKSSIQTRNHDEGCMSKMRLREREYEKSGNYDRLSSFTSRSLTAFALSKYTFDTSQYEETNRKEVNQSAP